MIVGIKLEWLAFGFFLNRGLLFVTEGDILFFLSTASSLLLRLSYFSLCFSTGLGSGLESKADIRTFIANSSR